MTQPQFKFIPSVCDDYEPVEPINSLFLFVRIRSSYTSIFMNKVNSILSFLHVLEAIILTLLTKLEWVHSSIM